MKKKQVIGFIGLGLMGKPMALNLLKAGFEVGIYNRTQSKTADLKRIGATVYSTPAELAKNSTVLITMVTAPDDVKQVLFGDQGVVKGSKKGLTVIDMSTIGPSAAKEIASTLANHDIEFLDAPVTGSTPGAINGTLTIFVGGNEEVFNQFKPVLEVLGTNIQYMGGIGMGQAIKLINNHLIAASVVALAEGMILADTMGLSRRKAAETLQTVPAMSAFMNLKIPNYVRNEFPLLFSAINMKKDLSLANGEAQKNNKKLPILSQVEKMYEELLKDHFEKEDMSIIIKLLENFK